MDSSLSPIGILSDVSGVQRTPRSRANTSRHSTSPRHAIAHRSRTVPTRNQFDYNFALCAIEDGSTIKHSTDFIKFSTPTFVAGLHAMSYKVLCLAYKSKLLAKQSLERERTWWAAKSKEYYAISRYLKHSKPGIRKRIIPNSGTIDNKVSMGNNVNIHSVVSGLGSDVDNDLEGDADDSDSHNASGSGEVTADEDLFQETVEDYSGRDGCFWAGKAEEELIFEKRFYAVKTQQYQGYAAYMDQADEPMDDSLEAVDLQLDLLRSHIEWRHPGPDSSSVIEALEATLEEDSDSEAEDLLQHGPNSPKVVQMLEHTSHECSDSEPEDPPPSVFSDTPEHGRDSPHSEDDDDPAGF